MSQQADQTDEQRPVPEPERLPPEPRQTTTTEKIVSHAIPGAAAGALLGLLVPGIGSIIGAALGALIGSQVAKKDDER